MSVRGTRTPVGCGWLLQGRDSGRFGDGKRRTSRRRISADGGLRAAGTGREATREPMRFVGGLPSGSARRERTTLQWHTFYRFPPYMNKYALNRHVLFLKTENHSFSQFENYVKIPGERTNVLCTKTKRGNRKHFVRKKEAFSQLFSRYLLQFPRIYGIKMYKIQ